VGVGREERPQCLGRAWNRIRPGNADRIEALQAREGRKFGLQRRRI
jgi:hypothetical protein